jgi:hypothetical protein
MAFRWIALGTAAVLVMATGCGDEFAAGGKGGAASAQGTGPGPTNASAASGSGAAGGASGTGGDAGAGGGLLGCGPGSVANLMDDFNDNMINVALWSAANVGSASIAEVKGELTITLPAGEAARSAQYLSVENYVLRRCSVSVEVKSVPEQLGAESFFYAEHTGGLRFAFRVGPAALRWGVYEADVPIEEGAGPIDLGEQLFLRIRATDEKVFWETSADGVDFIIIFEYDFNTLLGQINVGIGAAASVQAMEASSASFDNVNILAP